MRARHHGSRVKPGMTVMGGAIDGTEPADETALSAPASFNPRARRPN